MLSIALHGVLLFLVPLLSPPSGGSSTVDEKTEQDAGIDAVSFSTFDPDMTTADASGDRSEAPIAPLPVANLTDLLEPQRLTEDVETEAVSRTG